MEVWFEGKRKWSEWRDSNSRPPEPQLCNESKTVKIAPRFTPVNKGENKGSVTECKVQFRCLPICLPFFWNDYSSARCSLMAALITQALGVSGTPMISTAGVSSRWSWTTSPKAPVPHIADGIAACEPSAVFFENVQGHVTLGLRDVLCDLGRMGYRTTWGMFSAAEVGAPHQRKRVFTLG